MRFIKTASIYRQILCNSNVLFFLHKVTLKKNGKYLHVVSFKQKVQVHWNSVSLKFAKRNYLQFLFHPVLLFSFAPFNNC